MAKITTISFADDDYEILAKLAKIEGKSFSKFVKDKLKDAVMQEMRETSLLERLVRMIENLQNFQSQTACRLNDELLREIYKLLLYTVSHDRAVFELLFVLPEKRKEYLQRRKELEEKLGLEL